MNFLKELNEVIDSVEPNKVPAWVARYYRKLFEAVTQEKCAFMKSYPEHMGEKDCVIVPKQKVFQPFVSSFTLRTLKPFILVDKETIPQRVKLLSEICARQNRRYKRRPIMYKYVQERHIEAINRLCAVHFWPGIDVSEVLEFPEFSVVVEYRQLIIGFGFLVPDVNSTDAYISFIFTLPGWRRAGIARYMLYHLINTCRGKDITLHVSASNTQALLLYQQFSFKPQEFIQNFYEKFMPSNSRECRHAFFLRLSK